MQTNNVVDDLPDSVVMGTASGAVQLRYWDRDTKQRRPLPAGNILLTFPAGWNRAKYVKFRSELIALAKRHGVLNERGY